MYKLDAKETNLWFLDRKDTSYYHSDYLFFLAGTIYFYKIYKNPDEYEHNKDQKVHHYASPALWTFSF